MNDSDVFAQLAAVVLALEDSAGLEHTYMALENGQLERQSTAATRSAISEGSTALEMSLRSLQALWNQIGDDLSPAAMAAILRTTNAAMRAMRDRTPTTEVVWTGQKVDGSFLRATREIVREILLAAHWEVLLVGYWIAARDDREKSY